jgi:hypothetical protein
MANKADAERAKRLEEESKAAARKTVNEDKDKGEE